MEKTVIYQIFTRLFGQEKKANRPHGTIAENGCGKFNHITTRALEAIAELGVTHIWFTGVIEHASLTQYEELPAETDSPDVVKGRAGSPYAIRDYYDVSPDLAESVPQRLFEFRQLIDRTHRAAMKAIIDFVPNHVARRYHSDVNPAHVADFGATDRTDCAFSPQNNFYYFPSDTFSPQFPLTSYHEQPARATGNDCFSPSPSTNDWYDTVKLNYGVDYLGDGTLHDDPLSDTWLKMRAVLLYWAEFGIDGFRCDMAEMVHVSFWRWVIGEIRQHFPSILFIAEIYQPSYYGAYLDAGFDFLYDKVGFYDTLRAVICHQTPAAQITCCWQQVGEMQSKMLYFLENHDEQRIASSFFAGNSEAARPALAVAALLNTNPVMIYAGQELGERGMDAEGFSGCDGRTSIFDYWGVDTLCRWYNSGKYDRTLLSVNEKKLRQFYASVLSLARSEKAFTQGHFFDLMYCNNPPHINPQCQYAFLRACGDDVMLVIAHFSDERGYVRLHFPQHAFDCLNMHPKALCCAVDLLSGERFSTAFTTGDFFETHLEPHSARVFKICGDGEILK
ncbi:MAG: alpha-amylase [Prevotellaceae bacterium]|jgi:glycosidase|nr:alpha-amylase [Prevotellaceae bacterium]